MRIVMPSPVRHPDRFLTYARSCKQYGALAMDLKARFEADPDFSFSAFSHQNNFTNLPKYFQKALHFLYRRLTKARRTVAPFAGKSPQAAFNMTSTLRGRIVDYNVGPYFLLFAMDGNDFSRIQGDRNPLGTLRGAMFGYEITACVLHASVLRDQKLSGLVHLVPQKQEGDPDPISIRHETLHTCIAMMPVIGVWPLRSPLEYSLALTREASQHSQVRRLIEAAKLTTLSELQCLTLNNEISASISREDFGNIMKAYKPVPPFIFRQFTRAENHRITVEVIKYYQMVNLLWSFRRAVGKSPDLGQLLLGFNYAQIAPCLEFFLQFPHLFHQIAEAPAK